MKLVVTFTLALFIWSVSAADTKAGFFDIAHGESITAEGAKAVLKVAYERLGMNLSFSPLPRKRALKMTIIGQKDGEVIRRLSVAQENPTLLAVKPPIFISEIVAYYPENASFKIENINDLAGLRVIRLRGIVSHELIAEKAGSQIVAVDYQQATALLTSGRGDVLLGGGIIRPLLEKDHSRDVRIVGTTLESDPLYHILHIRNIDFVPELEAVLKEMDESGEREMIFQTRVNELLQSTNIN